MADDDDNDDGATAGRGYAAQILLDPAVVDANNVQDALATMANGLAVIGDFADIVTADNPTDVPMDGALHQVPCIIASPPSWMDDAGNITEPGVYSYTLNMSVTTPATTSGLFACGEGPIGVASYFPVDATAGLLNARAFEVFSIGAAEVPVAITGQAGGQNDATGHIGPIATIQRLVAPAPTVD